MSYGRSPEDPTIAIDWLKRHGETFGHHINGTFRPPGTTFPVINPATEQVLAQTTQGTEREVNQAVRAARRAQNHWQNLGNHERARHLYALARHLQQHSRFLAVLETLNTGKPIRESRDIDIPLAVRHFYHHAGWAEIHNTVFPDHVPHGVCGQVIPWNFPLLMLAWKVAPALAAGNTVVLKPAEYTPLTALAFAEIATGAGLPKGVVNIITGDGETGTAIVNHPGINKVAFTGSTEVGRLIRQQIAGTDKSLTLELGGKSPFLVFADADLDAAVEGVVDSIWFNQGQVCCAGSRILVAESIAERFESLLRRRMETLRPGEPLDKSTDIGAIIHPDHLQRIQRLVNKGIEDGADLHQGRVHAGCYFPPTLVTNVQPASVLATEEIFGPVVTLTSFRTPSDAITLANATRYGLAASVWSENINQAIDMAAGIRAGVVWINCANQFDAGAGFGGYRESGFGREGGREGMAAYLTRPKPKNRKRERLLPPPVATPVNARATSEIDRTAKLYIGGRQTRPDSGHSYSLRGRSGPIGRAGLGNRKDIRNAVEAAGRVSKWAAQTGHNRAQILYYIAENLAIRRKEFTDRLHSFGATRPEAEAEVEASIRRLFWYAAWADKHDGAVHQTRVNYVTLAMHEPLGVIGIACPASQPLLALISLIMPAIALGNTVVAIPSQTQPLAATDFYQILETSDLPAGVVNIVTGERDVLAKTLAEHDAVAAIWYFGSSNSATMIENAAAGNLKQSWIEDGGIRHWLTDEGQGPLFLEHATQIKNIWIPYGA
ncbi:MAG: aldehyde dehydrogenase family protein [Rhodobacteraceae bacterium]|nr:aldehyde dehydrogenase family protein [Paracoccaceae bacterium]